LGGTEPDALTEAERTQMAGADALVLSAVAVWELRLKWHSFHISGGRKGPVDPASVVAFAAAIDWELLPLTARHAAAELAQPLGHKDPFDELLLVQAQEERMRLLTRDAKLIGHPLAVAG
jgi:PIN domain nuclease of toxin-antitoxin system